MCALRPSVMAGLTGQQARGRESVEAKDGVEQRLMVPLTVCVCVCVHARVCGASTSCMHTHTRTALVMHSACPAFSVLPEPAPRRRKSLWLMDLRPLSAFSQGWSLQRPACSRWLRPVGGNDGDCSVTGLPPCGHLRRQAQLPRNLSDVSLRPQQGGQEVKAQSAKTEASGQTMITNPAERLCGAWEWRVTILSLCCCALAWGLPKGVSLGCLGQQDRVVHTGSTSSWRQGSRSGRAWRSCLVPPPPPPPPLRSLLRILGTD